MENYQDIKFGKFNIRFGEEDSELNTVLSELVFDFNINSLSFIAGIVNNKLEPFNMLSKLIRVKKIDLFLDVLNEDEIVVGTFKLENCNFLNVSKIQNFLNMFTKNANLKKLYHGEDVIKVDIDVEAIKYEDVVLYKKESKIPSDLERLSTDSFKSEAFKVKGSGINYGEVRLGGTLFADANIERGEIRFLEAEEERGEVRNEMPIVNRVTGELYANRRQLRNQDHDDIAKAIDWEQTEYLKG